MTRPSLFDLENHSDFIQRHIGPTVKQQTEMAQAIGYDNLDALIDDTVPGAIRREQPLQLPGAKTEQEVIARLRELASLNIVNRSFIGTGYNDTITPPVIQRNVLENPGWYTAYTPYQPEISQGRLEALLTFQQMILDLTGMDLANASMLDESTAAAEAMTMLQRVNKKNRSATFLVADDCHPQTISVVKTRAEALDIEVVVGNPQELRDLSTKLLQIADNIRRLDSMLSDGRPFLLGDTASAADLSAYHPHMMLGLHDKTRALLEGFE